MSSSYHPTIGVETHVQLKTKTKLFSAVGNDATVAPPNTLISHIDTGMPGALPVLNSAAIDLCVKAAFALHTKPQKFSKFERKHYFYPDLPKGYQITQYENPIIKGGEVQIRVDGISSMPIGIERAHLEEDAGKNTHPPGADYSLVDLNRAGTPLLEIVSKPQIHSPAEAKAFARELYLIMKYAGVTDGDLYHGHIRFDLNISVSKDSTKLGIRSEVKNLNSFRSVEAATAYEIKRQIETLESGGEVIQETRGWDEAKQKTFAQRKKEEAEDYRYMPEPDIPPLYLEESYTSAIVANMPKLPTDIRNELSKIELKGHVIEDILDRPAVVEPIVSVLKSAKPEDARRVAFWLIGAEPKEESLGGSIEPEVDTERLIELSRMVDEGQLSSTAAKKVFDELLSSTDSPDTIATRLNLTQISGQAILESLVDEVISENQQVVNDIKKGQTKAIAYLVGRIMHKSKGQANPQAVQQIIKNKLEI